MQTGRQIPKTLAGLLLLGALLAGCASAPEYPRVSLSEAPPSPTHTALGAGVGQGQPPLRVAIAAVISPRSTVQSYTPLLDYLEQRTGRPVELVQRRTYAEVNDLLRDGGVDLALVCSGTYIIVPTGSPAQSLADLGGKTFAFTDPMSNSGRLQPTYMLSQMGLTPESFFGDIIYTYGHENSIRAVSEGLVDGAGVDSLVYDYALSRDPTLAERVRVIDRSGASGIPPVVVHPDLDADQKRALRDVLLSMHQEEAGRAALEEILIDRFVTIGDDAYRSVREALDQVGDAP